MLFLAHITKKYIYKYLFLQGFGREKDENQADLCLYVIVFSLESGRL